MKRFFLVFSTLILLFTLNSFAQISLHPAVVFIDPQTRSAEMRVANKSKDPREVKIQFMFGYSSYDEKGNSYLEYEDSVAREEYSLEDYVKIFPKKLIIPPEESQVIRFLITNTSKLESKTYWTRIKISSEPIVEQVDTVVTDVQAKLIIKTEMIGLIVYQHGNVKAGVDIQYRNCTVDSNYVNLVIKHNKTGNSPFWGTMVLDIYDDEDDKLFTTESKMAIYFDCLKKIQLKKDKLNPGKYKAEVFINNEREVIPAERRTQFNSIKREFEFTVPEY